ncbi:hypothetical protein [Rhizobium sp. SSA_523]|uniref:hypothetical protein n=1 Tax=Rhizobium sp. SSA_523 TaxID=2952477 RepID=UPI0020918A06|nr:hypothetical protein [Rhizobium sp. SSA_523]MCO5733024.1 hypothetical protein [Rhizobium sp. SSA_523]WKC23904.1 hypothetical protein QTJ18_24560 [Rhizobium sp. SSA_523]
MAPVILVTFAGRQKRMSVLTRYIRKALDLGIIDEWHVWDFTRSPEDHDWVTAEFGPVRFMGSKVPYQAKAELSVRAAFRASMAITNDLHIALLPENDPEHFYELVIGGWNNQASALRKCPRDQLGHADRSEPVNLWSKITPGILSPGAENAVVISLSPDGVATLEVNSVVVGEWPDLDIGGKTEVMVRGGWGGNLEICDAKAPVRRYIGNPNEPMPYWQAYDYYARRLSQFTDAVFLKCDDDIVYLDLDRLSGFIDARRRHPHYFLLSANVINNGICAHLQQQAGSLPATLGTFEHPPGGFGGSLWQSGERAVALHEHFLQSPDKRFPLSAPLVEWTDRQSINFIAWLGRDIIHMALAPGDDERVLTVDLPAYLGRTCAIHSDFVVSHLSFGPQERGADFEGLVDHYDALMQERLSV